MGSANAEAPPRPSYLSSRAATSLQARMTSLSSCTKLSAVSDTVGSFSPDLIARLDADKKAAGERVMPSSPLSFSQQSRTPTQQELQLPSVGVARGRTCGGLDFKGTPVVPDMAQPNLEVQTVTCQTPVSSTPPSVAAVRLQRAVRGMLVRKCYMRICVERAREEWIAYYVYHGKFEEARELG